MRYGTTSPEFFILFEFTDSVCPLGACSLILIWVILFLISHNMETFPYKSQARRRWCPAEASSPVAAQATVVAVSAGAGNDAALRGPRQLVTHPWSVAYWETRRAPGSDRKVYTCLGGRTAKDYALPVWRPRT